MMRETRVEQYLTELARGAGGDSYKLTPTTAGLPDRIVLLPGGRIIFVELKVKLLEEPRPVQKLWHRRAWDRYQVPVVLLHGTAECAAWRDAGFPTPYVCDCMSE